MLSRLKAVISRLRRKQRLGESVHMDLKWFTRLMLREFYDPTMRKVVDQKLDIHGVRVPFSLAVLAVRRKQYVVRVPRRETSA